MVILVYVANNSRGKVWNVLLLPTLQAEVDDHTDEQKQFTENKRVYYGFKQLFIKKKHESYAAYLFDMPYDTVVEI